MDSDPTKSTNNTENDGSTGVENNTNQSNAYPPPSPEQPTAQMFCPNCKGGNPLQAVTCMWCGRALSAGSAASKGATQSTGQQYAPPPSPAYPQQYPQTQQQQPPLQQARPQPTVAPQKKQSGVVSCLRLIGSAIILLVVFLYVGFRLWDAFSGKRQEDRKEAAHALATIFASSDPSATPSDLSFSTTPSELTPSMVTTPEATAQPKDPAEIRTLSGHTDPVHSIAFSPDGQTLASGSDDKSIKLWKVSDGTEIRTLSGHSSTVESVAFSPDGQTLASGSWDNSIKLWKVSDGTEIRTLSGHTDPVSSVVFSPDGQTLASGSGDKTIKLWKVK